MRLSIAVVSISLLALLTFASAGAATAAAAPSAPAAPVFSKAVAPIELDAIVVLALSQADGRAVVALPDKQLVVVKAGDPIPRTRAVLKQVLADKLVLDEKSVDGKSRQMAWMHKGQGATPGRIERFATEAAPTFAVPAPLSTVVPLKRPAVTGKP